MANFPSAWKRAHKVRDYDYDLDLYAIGNQIVVSNFKTKTYYCRPLTLREFALIHKG